ncbi:hypothetical protein P152DRAFT_510600 [Eremomyces bilateralis CBS 781.70]|uniref:Prion-inhibition and propagation HeLo domain-containing protein n=1 Tax=Eremomyces bilateralis CBS 781.70 TaxID=1392243 RepID=A0A6G1GGZ9_9PEZI|nr:uncharacterized protein P152DRAFT_510600 [Eremomyces bilateralis CBS 781.70]KAF1817348.1 hypothetical protein P152DRAFT_510600 [Eremomyces bilateralis CBS 781.70]
MTELAAFAFDVAGVTGSLDKLYDGCVKGYRAFTASNNLGPNTLRLLARIRIEEFRLLSWARQWGVEKDQFDRWQEFGGWGAEGLKDLARLILSRLLETIMDCEKLEDIYGLQEESPGSVDKDLYSRAADPRNYTGNQLPDGWILRANWVIDDPEKFEVLLKDLRALNDRLEKLFPPSHVGLYRRSWTSELLLQTHDTGHLEILASATDGPYPYLNNLVHLKQLRINMAMGHPFPVLSSQLSVPRKQIWARGMDVPIEKQPQRASGLFKKLDLSGNYHPPGSNQTRHMDVPILIDWIPYDTEKKGILNKEIRDALHRRIDDLARLLYSCNSRNPDLHMLDCLGYTDDARFNRFGIIHACPVVFTTLDTASSKRAQFPTLHTMMNGANKSAPELDVRFRLASILATTLWSFHSLDWLHKSYCCHNIIFFGSPTSGHHDLSAPYVLGLDSSRQHDFTEMIYDPMHGTGNEEVLMYRHPESMGVWKKSFHKGFDIYALGLLLLEIGMWKTLEWKSQYSGAREEFKANVLQNEVPALGAKTGTRYHRLVFECLQIAAGIDHTTADGYYRRITHGTTGDRYRPPIDWVAASDYVVASRRIIMAEPDLSIIYSSLITAITSYTRHYYVYRLTEKVLLRIQNAQTWMQNAQAWIEDSYGDIKKKGIFWIQNARAWLGNLNAKIQTRLRESMGRILVDLSYVTDWLILLSAFGIGIGLNYVTPAIRPFSLNDPSISYPFLGQSMNQYLLWTISLAVPAVLILMVELIVLGLRCRTERWAPSDAFMNPHFRWNLHVGYLGLAMSFAVGFVLVQAIQTRIGKPRPNMIARCHPELSRIKEYTVSTVTTGLFQDKIYVSPGICQFQDVELRDAFRSFPSRYATLSWSGLFYFSLYYCYRFGVTFLHINDQSGLFPAHNVSGAAAAAPLYLFIAPFATGCTALIVTCSRYFDYNNSGIDVIAGALLGIASAWFALRWYHPAFKAGEREAWRPRSRGHAFWAGKVETVDNGGVEMHGAALSSSTAADSSSLYTSS